MKKIPLYVLMLLLCVSGCGDGKVRISGKILYDGQAVERGAIAFVGEKGKGTVFGEQFSQGSYSARVPIGEYIVRITGFESVKLDKPTPGVAGAPPTTEITKSIIPAKYNMFSQMTVEIDGSKTVFDFDLEK